MYKLFYAPGACSLAVHVALIECGLPFTLEKVDIHSSPSRPPELLKANARGQVPTLLDGDRPIVEGAAILITLCEAAKSPLLPSSGKERTEALEWLMFCNASLHPAYSRMFGAMRSTIEATAKGQLIDDGTRNLNDLWKLVETRLEHAPCLAGPNVTIGDILLTVIANWTPRMPKPVTIGPKTKELLKKISSRPAFQKALAAEQVEYQAAA